MLMEFLSAIKQTINGNLSKSLDVLIQEKTTEINTKVDGKANQTSVGITNDTGGTSTAGSIFAKLNKLLTDWNATRAGYLDTTISSRATQTSVNILQTTANAIKAKTDGITSGGSVVKSVQRGISVEPSVQQTRKISISTVNPLKSLVLIDGSTNTVANSHHSNPVIFSFTANEIVISASANLGIENQLSISWQVIEFY